MKMRTRGEAFSVSSRLLARVASTPAEDALNQSEAALLIRDDSVPRSSLSAFRAILAATPDRPDFKEVGLPRVCSLRSTSHLNDGDVVEITPQGEVRTLFREGSAHNAIFATDRCNSNCIMCSQPPKDHEDNWRVDQILEMIRLIRRAPPLLTITGGEPTLLGPGLLSILSELGARLPVTPIHMLTNGRRFARPEFTRSFSATRHPRLTVAVPIYSDHAQDHDYVVQSEGAFDQTILGLHELARYSHDIEVRVVIHLETAKRLPEIAEFIWRNLPFAGHVALMGLEPMGYTKKNREHLWIDPVDYQDQLRTAVRFLALRDMNVSVYNHQLCVLDSQIWQFARKSISDWKNIYLPVCDDCGVKVACGGFFASAERDLHSAGIHAI